MREAQHAPGQRAFRVVAEAVDDGAWHVTVPELPGTWTVAFALDDIAPRARQRIALDTGLDPEAVDVEIVPTALFIERRATHRFD
jgi:predicted RNase H-like HicB family nuclease